MNFQLVLQVNENIEGVGYGQPDEQLLQGSNVAAVSIRKISLSTS